MKMVHGLFKKDGTTKLAYIAYKDVVSIEEGPDISIPKTATDYKTIIRCRTGLVYGCDRNIEDVRKQFMGETIKEKLESGVIKCEYCKWWHVREADFPDGVGECRRNGPQQVDIRPNLWPYTLKTDYCRECEGVE